MSCVQFLLLVTHTHITSQCIVSTMRLALVFLLALGTASEVVVLARSSGRPSTASSSPPRRSSSRGGSSSRGDSPGRTGSSSRRPRDPIDDDDDDDPRFEDIEDNLDDNAGGDDDDDYDDDDYDEVEYPSSRRRGPASSSSSSGGGRRRVPTPGHRPVARFENNNYEDEDDEEYDEEYYSPSRSSSSSARRRSGGPPHPASTRRREGRVVAYNQRSSSSSTRRRGRPHPNPPSTFTRGLSAIRDKMPDPNVVKDTVLSATKAAQERTAQLSSNIYREVKGLTSSELEQVMLKATRPDETPVKTKHVERLVGVTYQISGKYDIYDAVLRKLWNKMAEKDIRTKLKSVYILHRFAVDGGPDHQEALKQRLRALRKTKDPKRSSSGGGGRGGGGSTRYFDSKVLLGVDDDVSDDDYESFAFVMDWIRGIYTHYMPIIIILLNLSLTHCFLYCRRSIIIIINNNNNSPTIRDIVPFYLDMPIMSLLAPKHSEASLMKFHSHPCQHPPLLLHPQKEVAARNPKVILRWVVGRNPKIHHCVRSISNLPKWFSRPDWRAHSTRGKILNLPPCASNELPPI